MIEYSKLQIGCMLIVIYIAFIYFRERYAYKVKKKKIVFELLLFTGIVSIAFDGITAYTVNSLNKVPVLLNDIFHACFLCSLDAIVFLIFLYIMDITRGLPKKRKARIFISLPFAVFDAVSAKRCYRDAMPLEQCFSIIENGSGQDFDPYITDVFLDMKEIITNIVENS